MRDLRSACLGGALAIVLAACVAQPGSKTAPGSPTTSGAVAVSGDDCSAMDVSADYCRRLANWARGKHGLPPGTALRLDLLPLPTCGTTPDGQAILCTYLSSPPRTLRARTASGDQYDLSMCGGVTLSAICYEHPTLSAAAMDGYWDVPCSGEAPSTCATSPAVDPNAEKQAKPLVIDRLDHPVGAVGHHEDEVGTAVLPNGILSKARIDLAEADQVQRGFIIDPIFVRLQVEPTDPNRPPFDSAYLRGRFPGVETVKVVLVYDVVENPDDAVLHFRNIEVR